ALPSAAKNAPSGWPENPLPSGPATPRLSQPQQTVLMFCSMPERCSQISAPVLASSAKTSLLPVAKYMTPSFTIGVPSIEYLAPSHEPRCTPQAPFHVFMVLRLIRRSLQQRLFLPAYPHVM